MSTLSRLGYMTWFTVAGALSPVSRALGQDFGGPIPAVPGTPGPDSSTDIRAIILGILEFVLSFLALIAVIYIIIAGIRLIVSQGEEEQKEKAKKTILYVILGLIVILLARIIVGFFTSNPLEEFVSAGLVG